ncbi:MAG TPA: hydrogenase/urease maturation nickel metallochaperone HypA [Planctomycetota bacterium]|nr:hydrogenase/urease maturation nickel metallochaperone HypA [Planctomycetota bacterium]
MHEFSLINDLMRKIEEIARANQAAKVSGVKVKLGAMAHISADHFREHFEHAATGTVADGATLEIECGAENDPQAQDIILLSVNVDEPEG